MPGGNLRIEIAAAFDYICYEPCRVTEKYIERTLKRLNPEKI
jgi:hypothetical protein